MCGCLCKVCAPVVWFDEMGPNSATSAFSPCLANIVNKVILQVAENGSLDSKSL